MEKYLVVWYTEVKNNLHSNIANAKQFLCIIGKLFGQFFIFNQDIIGRQITSTFHRHITVSATEAFLLPDPECGMLYLKNSDRTQVSDSLGAN